MEREKLEKAVLQRVAGGASIEAAAKEFKVTEKLVYTWLTIAHLEKGAECMREREAEEAIIDQASFNLANPTILDTQSSHLHPHGTK